jgi:hypothetical protein
MTHVAIAVRPVTAVGEVPLTVQIRYSAEDSFVEIIPPVSNVRTGMTTVYTPHSRTTGAQENLVGLLRSAPGFSVSVAQAGRQITRSSPYDFGSEIPCVGPVTPAEPIEVHLSGPGTLVVLFLTWK